ncbi:MAG: hypothetical protein KTR31_00470, partial [Myxococcales bacterium]|nr:hypothetical protein [Myxococcales bacterium]
MGRWGTTIMDRRGIELVLWHRRLRDMRVAVLASVALSCWLAATSGPSWPMLSVLALVPLWGRWASRLAPAAAVAAFWLVGAALVTASSSTASPTLLAALALFVVVVPAFGGLGAAWGTAVAVTVAAASA